MLQAHHIYPKALYPDLALNLDNGIILCCSHHLGIVHNHNSSVDIKDYDWESGWKSWVVTFNRWNTMKDNFEFNRDNQHRL